MIRAGINIELEWWDDDVAIAEISCSNGTFSGAARVYMNPDELPKLADALTGFPKDGRDRREVQLGAFEPSFAGGSIKLILYCTDSVGHAVAHVFVRADDNTAGGPGNGEFSIPVEAADVDSFVTQLRIPREEFGTAHLATRM